MLYRVHLVMRIWGHPVFRLDSSCPIFLFSVWYFVDLYLSFSSISNSLLSVLLRLTPYPSEIFKCFLQILSRKFWRYQRGNQNLSITWYIIWTNLAYCIVSNDDHIFLFGGLVVNFPPLITTCCDKVCQWLAGNGLFSLKNPVSSFNITEVPQDGHDVTACSQQLVLLLDICSTMRAVLGP
jgi:hypothetical protein